jgi:hypothetical protein
MKIRYRRQSSSDYSSRAARAEAKKLVLAVLAGMLADARVDDFGEHSPVPRSSIITATEGWTAEWQTGTRCELGRAVNELRAEFYRRAGRVAPADAS